MSDQAEATDKELTADMVEHGEERARARLKQADHGLAAITSVLEHRLTVVCLQSLLKVSDFAKQIVNECEQGPELALLLFAQARAARRLQLLKLGHAVGDLVNLGNFFL